MAEDLKKAEQAKLDQETHIQDTIKQHEDEKNAAHEKAQQAIQDHLEKADQEKAEFEKQMEEHK